MQDSPIAIVASIDESNVRQFVVEARWKSQRVDKFLADSAGEFSRTRIKRLFEESAITINGRPANDGAYRLKQGDVVCLVVPEAQPTDLIPNHDIPLEIVYEDADLLVINKQSGIAVHPINNYDNQTLVNALIAYCGDTLSGIGGVIRPGIVHRLDKDTTGLLLVAKHDQAHHFLSEQLADRTLSRVYYAICWGLPSPPFASIQTQIAMHPQHRTKMRVVTSGGKEALTHYRVVESLAGGNFSVVECHLATGRTHQIRVHMSHRGHSIIGDPLYQKPLLRCLRDLSAEAKVAVQTFSRQALHAAKIQFIHPSTREEMQFEAPWSKDMRELYEALR